MKPIWLLDIDGVINAISPEGSKWSTYRTSSITGFEIKWAPALVERIAALHATGQVRIRWCTTWEHDANRYFAPLVGLPQLPVDESKVHAESWWWKFEIAKLVADERPLIWTDDDLAVDGAWHEWTAQRQNLLAIAPDWKLGLQPEHMDMIETFVKEHANDLS